MKIIALIFLSALAIAQDAPKPTPPATVEQQLADARAEIKALREYIAQQKAYTDKRAAEIMAAYQACVGQPPQVPAAAPDVYGARKETR
jgi:predicted outer membrane protein